MDKLSLISKYQKESTAALERADYLLTDDLTVLQAFVISLTALFHVLSYAQETARQLNISNSVTTYSKSVQQRQQLIMVFKTRTDELFVGCQPDQNNLNCYAKELAHSIGIFLQLLAVRPMENSLSSDDSQVTNVNLLRLAVEALDSRCRVYSSVKTQPWRWIAPLFFPWQALATSLAEILVCDDLHFVRSVWPLIEQSYESFITLGIESPHRRLQESMKEKMKRARSFHDNMLLPFLSSESGGSALSWELSPLTIFQYHAPPKSSESRFPESTSTTLTENLLPCNLGPQQNDFSTWNGDSELSEADPTSFESQFQFEDITTFDVDDVSQALHNASYEELFLQYTQH
ncbi:hypothetical protein BDV33DRAFT_191401 [Aspergillus novoparasiticus]|uniref:Fungal-specific transcription factor domain-containing protein n=1 Tax=Aspergillus novoparasiticus TaxID=986946 RepID=A0A5N6ERH2_9EURO|nr:hypothetical protein BDV33DRAFT_191401 [Aspergillus novoparasiticus]